MSADLTAAIERDALSVPEVAARIGMSARHIWRLIETGELPTKRVGRRVLIRVTDYERWLKESQ